jgi:ribosomal-protein-alanine N-acetyltransferase
MSQADAVAISRWHYPEPYSFYDWDADPDDLAELLDPARRGERYWAADDESGELAGHFSFKPREPGAVEIGLGLRPDLTGRGLGAEFVEAGLEHARRHFAPNEFVLAVAAFNLRAIAVYERAGFTHARAYRHATNGAEWDFLELRRPA